jgi:hypothetical protein
MSPAEAHTLLYIFVTTSRTWDVVVANFIAVDVDRPKAAII